MSFARALWIPLALVALFLLAGEVSAQGYYYPDSYEPYSYRSLARTGKYHGYWRDLGYGFRGQQGYYAPYGGYYAPYYGYNPLPPPRGGYYHPPANFPYKYRW